MPREDATKWRNQKYFQEKIKTLKLTYLILKINLVGTNN